MRVRRSRRGMMTTFRCGEAILCQDSGSEGPAGPENRVVLTRTNNVSVITLPGPTTKICKGSKNGMLSISLTVRLTYVGNDTQHQKGPPSIGGVYV